MFYFYTCRTIAKGKKYSAEIHVPKCKDATDWGCIRHLEHVQLALTISSHKRGALQVGVIVNDFPMFVHVYVISSVDFEMTNMLFPVMSYLHRVIVGCPVFLTRLA